MFFHTQNFLEANRPDNLPSVPLAVTPQYVAIASRDDEVAKDKDDPHHAIDNLFEAEGRFGTIDDTGKFTGPVSELTYVSSGKTVGGRMRAGDGTKSFAMMFDFVGVTLSKKGNKNDLFGQAVIDQLPTDVSLCFAGAPDTSGVPEDKLADLFPDKEFDAPLTGACEVTEAEKSQPFEGVEVKTPPTAFWLKANKEFLLDAALTKVDYGKTDAVFDDQTTKATLNVAKVPKEITGYVETPTAGGSGAVRTSFATDPPANPAQKPVLKFSAAITDADLRCTDPRLPNAYVYRNEDNKRVFKQALCLKGTIENLPTKALLLYDPTQKAKNFVFSNNGGGDVNLREVELHFVSGKLVDEQFVPTENNPEDDTIRPNILVVRSAPDGTFLVGLPERIIGDLVMPGTVDIRSVLPTDESTLGPPVKHVHAFAQNFIAPDPMPSREPDQRQTDRRADPRSDPTAGCVPGRPALQG